MPWAPERRRDRTPRRTLTRHDTRASSSARGYGYKWQQYCRGFKASHPLCCHCAARGITTPTEAVDHIQRVTGPQDPRFWDVTNHQPLCWSCHSRKTATE